ncbi:MAG: FAD-dependent oxidoreductase [Planctomycetaceae bacterium]|nr:FAD-dependent oxidoreductase [Planctomycetaceae bacterium]
MADFTIGRTDDLKDGQMKSVQAGEVELLLVRIAGQYYALQAKCTHYDGPLAKGLLKDGVVRCPWHHAHFDAASGDLRQPPAHDCLCRFDLRVEGETLVVTLPEKIKRSRLPQLAAPDASRDGRTFAIVGGGGAGFAAAQTLRTEGFCGRIVMISRDSQRPYDRPDLSKSYMAKGEFEPFLRGLAFYEKQGIELQLNRAATGIDIPGRRVILEGGGDVKYDKLLLATGAVPRMLDAPGSTLANIFTLRTFDDCKKIIAAAPAQGKAVVIGASFIAMEVAASLRARGLAVTVVAPDAVPFQRTLGDDIGRMFQSLHEENGVSFRLGRKVARFEGGQQVQGAVLDDGQRLDADLVVVGVGVRPATDFLKNSGLALNGDGSLTVDSTMHAGNDIYAAGDIAMFPDWRGGGPIRIEHWRLAEQLGQVAAMNMAARPTQYGGVPFFWTTQYKLSVRYLGYARDFDEVVLDGNLSERSFTAYYLKGGKVAAAASCKRDLDLLRLDDPLKRPEMPTLDEARQAAGGPAGNK